MITFNKVKIYNDSGNEIINDFSITLFGGCVLNVYGPNGVGKTTLLKHLTTPNNFNENDILLKNKCILANTTEYKKNIEFIGHEYGLVEKLSVFDNIRFWAEVYDHHLIVPSAIHTFGLNEYLEHKINEVSEGTKKRVALTRLLTTNSNLWLIDEPFAGLDGKYKTILENVFLAAAQNGKIVIYTSHSPSELNFVTNYKL